MDVSLIKTSSGTLAPYGQDSVEKLSKVKVGRILNAKVVQPRNPDFHRKLFALWNILFGIWSETVPKMTYQGQEVLPNFDRFRRDMTILAGFYNTTVNMKCEVRLEAKSISFSSMDGDEFESLYSAMIDVGLSKVLPHTNMTEEQLRNAVEEILHFDS